MRSWQERRPTRRTAAGTAGRGCPSELIDARIAALGDWRGAAKPNLLSGGNPQIAKGDGDAPLQACIGAMPGWKRDVGRRLDQRIVCAVPDLRKAVRWNSLFYGVGGQGRFLSFRCFTRYVKVTFFRGASLSPLPPGASKRKGRALPRHPTRTIVSTRHGCQRGSGRRPHCRGGRRSAARAVGCTLTSGKGEGAGQ
jgi:hypothetical protein